MQFHIVHSTYCICIKLCLLALQWPDNNILTYKIEENDKTAKSLLTFEHMLSTENKDQINKEIASSFQASFVYVQILTENLFSVPQSITYLESWIYVEDIPIIADLVTDLVNLDNIWLSVVLIKRLIICPKLNESKEFYVSTFKFILIA